MPEWCIDCEKTIEGYDVFHCEGCAATVCADCLDEETECCARCHERRVDDA